MRSFFALALFVAIAGCAETTRYVEVPGHPYKAEPTCKRTQPFGKFDERCDCPRTGFRNFRPPVADVGF
ncbi:hypothetical protein EET67_20195 [Pseudaminobacter arsenicus]|uniref:Lipoprotein n=1 Tax=Borborobacter arsenicus TaxID=1851146 RepID=A0A432V1A2_9HYPH|nr:hypothetical protein EET67_20195 [Pseudaminobacter arsenicus]